jgi:MATE family multidrug resistance protein
LQTATVLLDTMPDMVLAMMVGHAAGSDSTRVLAAFNLLGMVVSFVVGGWYQGITSATDTLCAQAFGGARLLELWLFCQAGLFVYLALVPFVVGVMWTGAPILEALGQDPSIVVITGKLLLVNSLFVPPLVLYGLLKSALQAQNIVSPFVTSSFASWIVSGALAYYLAFHTSLGYMGVAFAAPINWVVKAAVLLPSVLSSHAFTSAWPGWQWVQARALVPKVARLSGSGALMFLFQTLGYTTISLLVGLLPDAAVAITSNGIFVLIMSFCYMPLLGVGIAGSIRLGNALGAVQPHRAAVLSTMIMVVSVTVSLFATLFIALTARSYAYKFNVSVEATEAAIELIYCLLPMIPLVGVTYGLQAIFRACGKQWLGAQFNFVCVFVLGVPIGLLFAISFGGGVAGLWLGNTVGLAVFSVAGVVWLRRADWTALALEAARNTHLSASDGAGDGGEESLEAVAA